MYEGKCFSLVFLVFEIFADSHSHEYREQIGLQKHRYEQDFYSSALNLKAIYMLVNHEEVWKEATIWESSPPPHILMKNKPLGTENIFIPMLPGE